MNIEDHPTVKRVRARSSDDADAGANRRIEADWLRQLALDCGADDVGLVEIDRPALDSQRDELLHHYPWTKTLVSFVVRMNREPVRSSARSVANLEFHHSGELVDEVGRRVVRRLEAMGIRAVSPSMGFPMEMYQFPGSAIWVVSHKPIAVAAGLGHMGIHRNVIHPKFGNFILLGTVLVDAETAEHDAPIDYNPCLECRLCVAACPVGAIAPDGGFNFSACLTHNYREFMGGFTDWVEQVADSKDAFDYRSRASEPETASMWQSLSHGANYKSAYCMAVCPAGEDVIGPYLRDRARHIEEVVRPLQEKLEPVYVIKGSDAEAHARKKWKNKTVKPVGNALHPRSIEGMLQYLPFVFQPNQARDLHATYHFEFTGDEQRKATVVIRDASVRVHDGHVGSPDLRVTADSQTWLGFLSKERNLVWALAGGKFRISGPPKLLVAFGRCFPSAGVRHDPTPIRPNRSRLRPDPVPYRQNDPATGKIKWSGVLELTEVIEVTHNVKTFRLINPTGGKIPFAFLPGQFLTLAIEPSGIPTKRSYTIASSPACRDWIEITVKRETHGLVSRWLHDAVRPREALEVLAPNGTFTFAGEEEERIVLIGGGVGITPLMSVTRYLTEAGWPGDIHLILSFRNPGDYLFQEEIAALQLRNGHLKVAVTMSDPKDEPWPGPRGHIDEAFLASFVPDIATQRVHLCGPPAMMEAVTTALIGLGVPPRRIKKEAFGTITRDPALKTRSVGRIIGRVNFQMSQVSAQISEGDTVLDIAERAHVFIDNACRSGTCGACRIKLLSGKVQMPVEDSLTEEEKSRGYILACQAQAESDVVVES
jgi:ferredoxin-NADP reductase/putative sterol carrier protein/Fe-S-cluster-containing hydrogenase component 2